MSFLVYRQIFQEVGEGLIIELFNYQVHFLVFTPMRLEHSLKVDAALLEDVFVGLDLLVTHIETDVGFCPVVQLKVRCLGYRFRN
jgi:hypothetical protein